VQILLVTASTTTLIAVIPYIEECKLSMQQQGIKAEILMILVITNVPMPTLNGRMQCTLIHSYANP
jgi:hypothetical protein